MTIGTGNQIRTMYVGEGPLRPLDTEVNEVLMHQLRDHEIIDIKPLGFSTNFEYTAVLIVYKIIGV